jgi:hypothetical protein
MKLDMHIKIFFLVVNLIPVNVGVKKQVGKEGSTAHAASTIFSPF